MAAYKIVFKPSVKKDLHSLPKSVIARTLEHIEDLKDNPIPRHAIKLAGAEQLYRIRIGDYRVIYGVDKEAKQITVHYVRHRRDVYRKLS